MANFLKTMLPMIAFMLIPLWIPIISVTLGRAFDAVAGVRGGRAGATPSTATSQRQALRSA